MIPFTNAALTAIRRGGTAEDYDQPATSGAARWTGNLGVYVAEELRQLETAGDIDEVILTRVEIPYQVGALVARGDTLTYTYEGASQTRTARNLVRAELVGRVRVTLEDA